MSSQEPLWILGYGSLLFKPPPLTSHPIPGHIKGYARRFWQSSSDHRGTPERKGRVVTLIPYDDVIKNKKILNDINQYSDTPITKLSDLIVQCCVYYISPENAIEVKEYLDIREQDGYTLHTVDFIPTLNDPRITHDGLDPQVLKQLHSLPIDEQGNPVLKCQVYIGTSLNESFVGPETINETSTVIRESQGPSGTNRAYLEGLVGALAHLDERDRYLEELLRKVDTSE